MTCGVQRTAAPVQDSLAVPAAIRARDDLEQEIINSGYFEGAPFKWVGLTIIEDSVDETEPDYYDEIDQADGELPLEIEINVERLLDVSGEEMEAVYRKAILLVLVHVGEKYGLQTEHFRKLLAAMERSETDAQKEPRVL